MKVLQYSNLGDDHMYKHMKTKIIICTVQTNEDKHSQLHHNGVHAGLWSIGEKCKRSHNIAVLKSCH